MPPVTFEQSCDRLLWLVATLAAELPAGVPEKTLERVVCFLAATGVPLGLYLPKPMIPGEWRIAPDYRLQPFALEKRLNHLVRLNQLVPSDWRYRDLVELPPACDPEARRQTLAQCVPVALQAAIQARLALLPVWAEERLALYAAVAGALLVLPNDENRLLATTDVVLCDAVNSYLVKAWPQEADAALIGQVARNIVARLPHHVWGPLLRCPRCAANLELDESVKTTAKLVSAHASVWAEANEPWEEVCYGNYERDGEFFSRDSAFRTGGGQRLPHADRCAACEFPLPGPQVVAGQEVPCPT